MLHYLDACYCRCKLTALSHWTRGLGLPAYESSSTNLAPRSTVVSHDPHNMVAGISSVLVMGLLWVSSTDPFREGSNFSSTHKLSLNLVAITCSSSTLCCRISANHKLRYKNHGTQYELLRDTLRISREYKVIF